MSTRSALRTSGVVVATALAGILIAAPAQARVDPGTGPNDRVAPHTTPPLPPGPPATADDDAVEYLQLGAGLLAGLSIAGAAAAVASRRQHRDPQPV